MTQNVRRGFLKQSLGALAGPASVRVLGANDRIRIAQIGCGGAGRNNLISCLKAGPTECVAVCDIDDAQSAIAVKRVREETSTPEPKLVTRDFRRVLDLRDLDAVIISTPDHWHALPMIMACQSGRDVYVQKPLATSIAEGRMMAEAAHRYNRVVQVGTQQRSACLLYTSPSPRD